MMASFVNFFILIIFICLSNAAPSPKEAFIQKNESFFHAQNQLKSHLAKNYINTKKAKNLILFLGDGMSIATVTAARIINQQNLDKNLAFEEFPFTGLSRTYCLDYRTSDSACTATAYLGGVKANTRTIGVTGSVQYEDCKASLDPNNHVSSIAAWAQDAGMDTGFVTTTRVTHATPTGIFGHTPQRDWESDYDIVKDGFDPNACQDLAKQLVLGDVGKNLKVILGGGRKKFLPNSTLDENNLPGERRDGLDFTMNWKFLKSSQGHKAAYITNKDDLFRASKTSDFLLGLFHNDHMPYHLQTDPNIYPSLAEMTSVAIDVLSKKQNGFFLFVEGGRIDQAHHKNYAKMAFDETLEFAKAVKAAVDKTNDDTLIVVTSDHAHTMSISGKLKTGEDILATLHKASDDLLYETILYASGPGFKGFVNGTKFDNSPVDIKDPLHRFPGTVPLKQETHGGEDVVVYALGPWSHLFTGSYEQNYIPHAMAFAACIGSGNTACSNKF